MGSFAKATGGVGAALLTGGMPLTAFPAASMAATHVVRVPCAVRALTAAIAAVNTRAGGTLRLAPRCVYGVTTPATVATALPVITGDVTLLGGPGTTIRRDPAATTGFRLFEVATGARLRVFGTALLDGTITGLGGGVQNAGRLVLDHVTMAGDNAGSGGAIANLAGATAIVARSVLKENAAGVVGGGGLLNFGTATIFASVIADNTAPVDGGGVNTQASGTTQLIRSTVEGNTSGGPGGGMSNLGTTALNHTLVTRNQGSAGGGIATANTRVLISRSVVRDNRPDDCAPRNSVAGCTG